MKRREPLRICHNQELMDDVNWMFIWIKKYIHLKEKYPNTPAPSVEDLDKLMRRLFTELRKDSSPMVKY
jgi:hypothetical protein